MSYQRPKQKDHRKSRIVWDSDEPSLPAYVYWWYLVTAVVSLMAGYVIGSRH